MNVFLTGGTGFIGSSLARRLVDQGHTLRCLVRRHSRVEPLRELGAELIVGDVNDRAALDEGMQGCDWLFHLANLYSMWQPDPRRFTQVNVEGTRQVMEAALAAPIQKVIYVSTVAVFGKPARCPFDETDTPGTQLFSEYARTKAQADALAWQFYTQRELPLVSLYPGIVLGAGDEKASGRYIQSLIRRRTPSTIFHHSLATYVYVEDVSLALLRAAEKPGNVGEKYLVGNITLNGSDYARLISEVSGVPLPPFRLPDPLVTLTAHALTVLAQITGQTPPWGLSVDAAHTLRQGFCFDGSKTERELGISYTPIRHALTEAIASYRQAGR